MRKRTLLGLAVVLALCGGIADGVAAKGVGWMPAPGGVTVPGSPYRYIAIAPGTPDRSTVVARVERSDGRLDRWWHLPGGLHVPAVAYDGTAGGLSADGHTLVLVGSLDAGRGHPPALTRLAMLDTQRSPRLRLPGRPPRSRRPARFVDLRGRFSYDAISPDGSTIYLIRYLPQSAGSDDYEVRALDAKTGELLPGPIVDPDEAEPMHGVPFARATSHDGRWAYTFYAGDRDEPFIHALDTVARRAVCIDLPQLEGMQARHHYLLHLRLAERGRELLVMRHRLGPPAARPLLRVDTETFEVRKAVPVAEGSAAGPPWTAVSVGAALLLLGVAWQLRRGRRKRRGRSPGPA